MKKLVFVLSGATLVVGILAALLWQDLRAERAQLADLRVRVTEMEAASSAARAAASQTTPAPAAPGNLEAATATPASTPAAAADTNPQARLQQGLAKGIADVLTSAEGSDLIRNQVRAALAQQYPDLAAELRLTPAEAERFMDLLATQASSMTGDALSLLTGGNSEAAQQNQRKMIEKQLASEKEISRMLGNKYPAWQDYQGEVAARQQVSQLRSLLSSSPDVLTEAQSKPLISALGAEQTRINKEERNRMTTAVRSTQTINVMEDQLKSMTAQNERLVSTASSHLTTNQLDRYKRMLGQQETMLRSIIGSMNGAAK